MRLHAKLALGLGAVLTPWAVTHGDAPKPATGRAGLPTIEASYPLPELPAVSPRNANYTISAKLDAAQHKIDGSLILEWRNTSDQSLDRFPFHLYWNAFRNNLSTSARGGGSRGAPSKRKANPERGFGYMQVTSVRLLGATDQDLTPSLRYVQPDDGNADDRTVMEVATPSPVAPGATARFQIAWNAKIPYGDVGRAGFIHDYHFIVQWFPKIGVFWKGAWNAHQFHSTTEFFADYGVYDVRLTVPKGFVLGATGRLADKKDNGDGTESHRYVQEDVHDFAWTASRRYLERKGRFDDPGYPPVEIRLLLQPEHASLAERYLEATRVALRSHGAWSAPYPYPQITVVDPAWNSASGGMEYPTLFTGGANLWAPIELLSPDSVTVHECGHQFWYGLVGNNEFEEAWLDEGFNSYHTAKALDLAYGPRAWGRRYFGVGDRGRGSSGGWPVIAPGVWMGRGEGELSGLRRTGKSDPMARRAWEYRSPEAYYLNAYGKPALSLQTLEGLVGDETMTRILRTYARRYRFAHPNSEDFIQVVNEVTGRDYRWFFEETWYSSNLCDYAIVAKNDPVRKPEGYLDGPDGAPLLAPAPPERKAKDEGPYESQVTVQRLGEVRMPVEILIQFDDGKLVREAWDGKDRWVRFKYQGPAKVKRAVVDPEGKIALDVDPSNNAWVDEKGTARRASCKWAGRFLLWLQNLLELHTVLG